MSDLASKNTDSVTKAFQAGLISQRTALKELRAQSEITGMWTNITDEDIEKADATIQDPNEGMGDMGSLFGGEDQSTPENKPENGEKPGQDKLPTPKEKTAPGRNMEPQRTTDAASYKGQPRENNGRFGEKGNKKDSLIKQENHGKLKRNINRRPATIQLPKEEYAMVVSELNTNLTKEERKKKFLYKAIGNNVYFFENLGFNEYRFIRKEPIK
jgi:hypothetical protein